MKPFNHVMLIITEGCNLRCSYCFEQEKTHGLQQQMPWIVAKKAIDLFFQQVPEGMHRTSMTFFGGEPALAFDLLKKIIEYSYHHRTISGYTGNEYNYVLITNGTILTDEMFDWYSRLGKKLNIRVSVDGYKDSQDSTRRTMDGKGSWHLIERNLPRFRQLKENHGVKVHLLSTLNKSTCRDLYDNYTRLYELTGMNIASLFIHEDQWEDEDFKAIKEQVLLLREYCLCNNVMSPLCSISSAKQHTHGVFQSICSAGIRSFTVNYSGDIFSCHRAYYYGLGDRFKLGDVESGISKAKRVSMFELNNLNMLPSKCQECFPAIRRKCHICFPSNKKACGDLYSVSAGYCSMMKELHSSLLEREQLRKNNQPQNLMV